MASEKIRENEKKRAILKAREMYFKFER